MLAIVVRSTVVILALSFIAQAAPTVFFGEDLNPGGTVPPGGNAATARSQFLGSLTGVGNEDFETIAVGTTPPLALTFPGSSGSLIASLQASSGGVCSPAAGTVGTIECNGFGRFATSGTHWFHTDSNTFSVVFPTAISAFGFYGTDIGDLSGQLTATLTGASGSVMLTVPNTINAPDGSLLFWGFIDPSASYSSISFGDTAAGSDVFGFDDLVIGDQKQVRPTPEPSTWLTVLAGTALVALARKRRTR